MGRSIRFFVLVSFAVAASGCARRRRARECNAFIDKVNGALTEINQYTDTTGVDDATVVQHMKKLSQLYDQLAGEIGAMQIRTPDLKKGADEYQSMARSASAAARHMADAFEKKDVGESKSAEQEFKKVVTREHALISRINGTCSAN